MSTRCNVIIKDEYDKLYFYRHSDGYPEGAMPTLKLFIDWLKDGKIRDNVGQAAGWLIILGAMEYDSIPGYARPDYYGSPKDFKCGAYEPTTGIHGDIEFLYIIDLKAKTVGCYDEWSDEGKGLNLVEIY